MHRSMFLPATAVVLGLTAVTLLGLASLQPTGSMSAAPAANEVVVRRFYDAVNGAIATGDLAPLRSVVADDVVEHDPAAGTQAGRAGLEDYLLTLHASSPDLRLTVEAVVADGDRAIARVAATGMKPPRFLDVPLDAEPAGWGPVDVFRVADGKVIERWGSAGGPVLMRPAHEATFAVDVETRRALSVERLTLAPGARTKAEATNGPVIIRAESDDVTIKPEPGDATPPVLFRPGAASTSGEPLDLGEAARLPAGASLVVSEGTRFAIWNDGREPARIVVASMIVYMAWSGPGAPPPRTPPPGVTVETLAQGSEVPILPGPVSLVQARATLAPGGRLALPDPGGSIALVVETGGLRLVASEPAWIQRTDDEGKKTEREAALGRGDSAYLSFTAEGQITLWNDGAEPATVLVVALRLPSPGDEVVDAV